MEMQLNKISFLDEFAKVQNIENRKARERTEGFRYLHNMTTKHMAEGGDLQLENLDFSKFTYADLTDYMEYYENTLAPKIQKANDLFKAIQQVSAVFSPGKRYY